MATLDDLLSVLQGASNSAASTVSAPVDGINWILKKAGFPVSDKPVGGSDWLKDKGLMAEPKNQNLGYVGEAIGGVAPMLVGAYAPQIASKLNQMGVNLAAPRTLNPQTGAIVWHGSPHKFDKFDASKIGTGEGAQAYGHGLYVAESPDVAAGYRDKLSKSVTVDGKKLTSIPSDGPMGEAHNMVVRSIQDGMTPEQAIAHTKNYWLNAADEMAAFKKSNPELAARIDSEVASRQAVAAATNSMRPESFFKDPGSLYKIDLPDEHIAKMLDWDKPLSQQAPEVQKTLKSMIDDVQSGGFDLSRGNRNLQKAFNPVTREQVMQEIVTEYPHLSIKDGGIFEKSGRQIPDVAITEWMQNKHGAGYQDAGQLYRDLAHIVGSDAQISATMRNNGIPGIRYLDGGSRGTGQGTSNFVIFPQNEHLLKILERNGIPLD